MRDARPPADLTHDIRMEHESMTRPERGTDTPSEAWWLSFRDVADVVRRDDVVGV